MSLFNAVVGRAFDALLAPLAAWPPLAALTLVALVLAAITLLCFRTVSSQARIAYVKRQIQACIFECRLFQDDLPAVFRALGEILRRNVTYLGLSLVPLLWMAVPFALILTQLDLFFGYAASAGQPLLLTAQLSGADELRDGVRSVSLDVPAPVRVLTPPVWIPATRELMWRIEPRQAGAYTLTVRIGGASYEKALTVSDGIGRRSPLRTDGGLMDEVLHPSESPLPRGGPLTAIRLGYATRDMAVWGWHMPWLVPFIVLSLGWGVLLKRPLGVTI